MKHKNPRAMRSLSERFWEKVNKVDGGCWLWTAATAKGYGRISLGRKEQGDMAAHKVSWILHFGPVPDGLCVLHTCDVPLCIRPDHLWLGTNEDNSKDRVNKGRQARLFGEDNRSSKLTQAQVDEMRQLRAQGQRVNRIAARFGIRCDYTSAILCGRAWSHSYNAPNAD